MGHSRTLVETKLWRSYEERVNPDSERLVWIKEVYEEASKFLERVPKTFPNYTLHNETHILNVLDAMAGILGNKITNLSTCEMELLILAASLHDLGMVYGNKEKEAYLGDKQKFQQFLRKNCPEYLGCDSKQCPENIRQWYLRRLHPFRVSSVLQNKKWSKLMSRCPIEIVSEDCICAVCEAHGQSSEDLQTSQKLKLLRFHNTDPLFCALLLRLADLLDFDDTRAPEVLYKYAAKFDDSQKEFKKHRASAGFNYPEVPSTKELPYKAKCSDPIIEHTVRDFLDWIDYELHNCQILQKNCTADWQREFPFPRAISRKEIESNGYKSGDFHLTMDQAKILELFTGEHLYNRDGVFIRELLQNSIDATLLRDQMDKNFSLENGRIDLWEWKEEDKNGRIKNVWFRIDDRGTGMTLGMLKQYFLKVGNSYYTSTELKRDLLGHGCDKYQGISRFGIGFLSCFLSGDYAEVSTLYFDPKKNLEEEAIPQADQREGFGLRLEVTGLTGYYTLRSQIDQNRTAGPLKAPKSMATKLPHLLERNGYRTEPGTSILVRLDPKRLNASNLKQVAKGFLCGPPVPVFYNGECLGPTHKELIEKIHKTSEETVFELSYEDKKKFDERFPFVQGNYPKFITKIIPLGAEKYNLLSHFSGVLIKYDIQFETEPRWKYKDQSYWVVPSVYKDTYGQEQDITFAVKNTNYEFSDPMTTYEWDRFKEAWPKDAITALEDAFSKCSQCPAPEQLGDAWIPFMEKGKPLLPIWQIWRDAQQTAYLSIGFKAFPDAWQAIQDMGGWGKCFYQGIEAGDLFDSVLTRNTFDARFFLEPPWQPEVDVGRSRLLGVPLEVYVAISGILNDLSLYNDFYDVRFKFVWHRNKFWRLSEWRKLQNSSLGNWLEQTQADFFFEIKRALQEGKELRYRFSLGNNVFAYYRTPRDILCCYLMAYFQNTYEMVISYHEGQTVTFYEKTHGKFKTAYDLFPPMMFCKAATEEDRQYLCTGDPYSRCGVTENHRFAAWLLDNAELLNQYCPDYLRIIIEYLCHMDVEGILREFSRLHQQLTAMSNVHLDDMPKLDTADFWFGTKTD